ncbi:hypothetical protein M0802_003730 [Mischocyttarus mexicanus]|nr:hypothetical protein M0802_003730 [Mischocyttarus mexicanus]
MDTCSYGYGYDSIGYKDKDSDNIDKKNTNKRKKIGIMSEHGESDLDATEEINVDDSDSRSCSPRNYTNHEDRGRNIIVQETSECSNSPPPSQTSSRTVQNESPRSHPFSISRLLGDSQRQKTKSSTAETQTTNSTSSIHCTSAADLLAPFRLFPTGSSLIYTGGGVIRVPAHRPPGANGAPTGGIPAQALIPPWSLQALQHSQQQAAAAGLHRASLLANLAAHPLQAHPHLKDRLAGYGKDNDVYDDYDVIPNVEYFYII